MRHVQRGISMVFLVMAILVIAVAFAAGYFAFSQNLKEKVAAINSFEECAKHYPVMESYPEQCSTPDGKHFTRQLTEEEKQRLIPPAEPSPTAHETTTAGLVNIYVNDQGDFSVNYPEGWERINGGIRKGEDDIYIGSTMKPLEAVKRSYNWGDATLSNTATFSTKNISGQEVTLAEVTFMQHDGYGNYSEPEKSYVALIPISEKQTVSVSGDFKLKSMIDNMVATLKLLK